MKAKYIVLIYNKDSYVITHTTCKIRLCDSDKNYY